MSIISRAIRLALILAWVPLFGGCFATIHERATDSTGKTSVRDCTAVGFASCGGGGSNTTIIVREDRRGYDEYDERPYRLRPGEACRGPWGQTYGDICYPQKPRHWRR